MDNSIIELNRIGDTRGMHPNSRGNLRPNPDWKPGQSGNPHKPTITSRQKQMMSEKCPFDAKQRSWIESLAESGMRQALTIPVALSNLQDRHEGRVTQPDDTPAIVQTVVFVLPDGTRIIPGKMIEEG